MPRKAQFHHKNRLFKETAFKQWLRAKRVSKVRFWNVCKRAAAYTLKLHFSNLSLLHEVETQKWKNFCLKKNNSFINFIAQWVMLHFTWQLQCNPPSPVMISSLRKGKRSPGCLGEKEKSRTKKVCTKVVDGLCACYMYYASLRVRERQAGWILNVTNNKITQWVVFNMLRDERRDKLFF